MKVEEVTAGMNVLFEGHWRLVTEAQTYHSNKSKEYHRTVLRLEGRGFVSVDVGTELETR